MSKIPMTDLEIRLLACVREFRRLENQVVRNDDEVAANLLEADKLSELAPETDDRNERYDAPQRKAHRIFVNSLFHPRGW